MTSKTVILTIKQIRNASRTFIVVTKLRKRRKGSSLRLALCIWLVFLAHPMIVLFTFAVLAFAQHLPVHCPARIPSGFIRVGSAWIDERSNEIQFRVSFRAPGLIQELGHLAFRGDAGTECCIVVPVLEDAHTSVQIARDVYCASPQSVPLTQVNGRWRGRFKRLDVMSIGAGKLRLIGVFMSNNIGATVGSFDGIGTIDDGMQGSITNINNDPDCIISYRFAENVRVLEVHQVGSCGFGIGVYASGTYTKAALSPRVIRK